MLLLSADDVNNAVGMMEIIDTVAEAYQEYSAGEGVVPLRTPIYAPKYGGVSLFMPGYSPRRDAVGVKIVSVYPNNPAKNILTINALVIMLDGTTGLPVAVLEGSSLTALRTGAASGVASRCLARRNATTTAVIGTGVQARTQLLAVCLVRPISQVLAYDIVYEKALAYAEEMSTQLKAKTGRDITVRAVASSRAAVVDADIIVTTTTAKTPVISAADLKKGVHINAVGSFTPDVQEIGEDTVLQASKIVVDSREAVLAEAGDLIQPIGKGLLRPEALIEIGDIVSGKYPGRESDEELTLFKSVGISLLDMAVGNLVSRQALAKGMGCMVVL